MLHLAGAPVSDEAAAWLIVRLLEAADEDAAAAAKRIAKALEDGIRLLALTQGERDAVLTVLDYAPNGLTELRGRLLRDRPD